MPISGVELWEAIKEDRDFRGLFEHEDPAQIFQEYFEDRFPDLVGELADEQASLENIITLQITYCNNFISSGILKRAVEALPDEETAMFGVDCMVSMAEGLILTAVEMFEGVLEDIPAFLREQGISNRDFYEAMKLSEENIQKVEAGDLTVGELLLSQPAIILKQNNN